MEKFILDFDDLCKNSPQRRNSSCRNLPGRIYTSSFTHWHNHLSSTHPNPNNIMKSLVGREKEKSI